MPRQDADILGCYLLKDTTMVVNVAPLGGELVSLSMPCLTIFGIDPLYGLR